MLRILLTAIVLLSTTLFSNAQSRRESWAQDMAFLKTELPKRHINPFTVLSQKKFNARIDSLSTQIDSLTDPQIHVGLMRAVTALGDEHTQLLPDQWERYNAPIEFGVFEGGIYITGSGLEYTDLLRSRLIAIDGMPLSEILPLFRTIIFNENHSHFEAALPRRIHNLYLLSGLDITRSIDSADFTVVTPVGDTLTRCVAPSVNRDLPFAEARSAQKVKASAQQSSKYRFNYDPEHQLLLFEYIECERDPNLPFEAFTESLFDTIAQRKPRKLVVDLRQNDGGSSLILKPFLKRLSASEFATGKELYVLIGEKTFSSALMNAVDLKRKANATLVGRPTGGSTSHFGEVRGFNLPKSNALIIYSTKHFNTVPHHKGPLEPDVPIEYTFANYLQGTDEALEYIYKQE